MYIDAIFPVKTYLLYIRCVCIYIINSIIDLRMHYIFLYVILYTA